MVIWWFWFLTRGCFFQSPPPICTYICLRKKMKGKKKFLKVVYIYYIYIFLFFSFLFLCKVLHAAPPQKVADRFFIIYMIMIMMMIKKKKTFDKGVLK